MTRDQRTKRMVLLGLMMALVIVGNAVLRTKTPWGTFSFGNVLCALAGILLGPVGGGVAAGVGSMLYDILFYPAYLAECWITLLTKGAIGLTAGLVAWSGAKGGFSMGRNVAASTVGAATYLVLYVFKSFAWDGLFVGRLPVEAALVGAFTMAPMSIINAVIAVVCAPILAKALQKALKNVLYDPAATRAERSA